MAKLKKYKKINMEKGKDLNRGSASEKNEHRKYHRNEFIPRTAGI